MIDLPSAFRRAEDREQLGRLLRRQHGGRLVEDQDVGAAVERLQDLDPLLLADGDRSTRASGSTAKPNCSRDLADPLARRRVVVEEDARRASARSPSTMFSATVITGISMKCWCTIPIPALDRVLRRRERDRLAVDDDLALVGLGTARRGCSSASTCRRRSRRGARAPRRGGGRSRRGRWRRSPGKRFVIPRSSRTGGRFHRRAILGASDEGTRRRAGPPPIARSYVAAVASGEQLAGQADLALATLTSGDRHRRRW